jgi:uncharacterized protein (TIRG00374 family)
MSLSSLLKGKLIAILVFFLLLIAGFLLIADISKVGEVLSGFKWALLPVILFLTLLDDALRFVKWHYFLRRVRVKLSTRESALIFFSGLAMTLTPGKAGEAIKSYLVKRRAGVDVSRTLPVVVVERLTDLIAVTLLAAIGTIYFRRGIMATAVMLLLICTFVLVVQRKNFAMWIIDKLGRLPFVRRYKKSIQEFYESSCELLKAYRLAFAIAISMVAWGSECLGLYIVYHGLGHPQSFLLSSFVFSFSSVAGAISTLPGGLGVAEASMTGIMAAAGIEWSIAVSAMLLMRFCTLWFGFFVGFVVLMVTWKRFNLSQPRSGPCRE